MSTFNYARLAKITLDQIRRFGQKVTITRKVQGSYNASTSSRTITTSTQTNVDAVVEEYKQREIDGTMIQAGDIKMHLPALGVNQPSNNDVITTADSTSYTIKNVNVISPSGSPIMYTLQLRK